MPAVLSSRLARYWSVAHARALQVSEPPKKLRKWRKKLAKGKNQIIVPVGRHGRTLTVPNWAYKGPGDIYRGVTGAVLGTLPTALVYFLVYDRTSEALERAGWPHQRARSDGEHQDRAASVHLLSAACGALASSVVRVPGDTIRHQTQAYMHRNVFAAARTILSTRGVGGLYLGYLPTLLRDVPELAVQFTVYEALRKGVMRHRAHQWGDPQHKLATWEHLLLGGLAGAAAASVTMPLDFVKTRQQCGAVGGVAALVRGVVAAEGYRGLFSGLGPRVCHVAATSSVFFGLFEGCKLLLKPDRTEQDRLLLPKVSAGAGRVPFIVTRYASDALRATAAHTQAERPRVEAAAGAGVVQYAVPPIETSHSSVAWCSAAWCARSCRRSTSPLCLWTSPVSLGGRRAGHTRRRFSVASRGCFALCCLRSLTPIGPCSGEPLSIALNLHFGQSLRVLRHSTFEEEVYLATRSSNVRTFEQSSRVRPPDSIAPGEASACDPVPLPRWLLRQVQAAAQRASAPTAPRVADAAPPRPPSQAKKTKAGEGINARLQLVMKSGKYTLGYKTVLKCLRSGKGAHPRHARARWRIARCAYYCAYPCRSGARRRAAGCLSGLGFRCSPKHCASQSRCR